MQQFFEVEVTKMDDTYTAELFEIVREDGYTGDCISFAQGTSISDVLKNLADQLED